MGSEYRLRKSDGTLQRKIVVDDTTGHVKTTDGADTDVMDTEAHASRHASGGADALPTDAIETAMVQDAAITSAKVASKSQYRLESVAVGVAIGAAGAPATIATLAITSGYNNLLPLLVKATPAGLGTAETATFHVVATFDDATTATLVSRTTAAGSTATETATVTDLDWSLIGDTRRITQIDLTAESSATSTTATATGSISAMENYV